METARKRRVLIVDDEEIIRQTVAARLEAAGYEVSMARDGQEGLEKARAERPDLVVLDLMLPKLNGYQVCKMLKGDARYQKIPVLLLTALANEKDEQLGFENGADAYLRKPFQTQEFLQSVRTLAGGGAESPAQPGPPA